MGQTKERWDASPHTPLPLKLALGSGRQAASRIAERDERFARASVFAHRAAGEKCQVILQLEHIINHSP